MGQLTTRLGLTDRISGALGGGLGAMGVTPVLFILLTALITMGLHALVGEQALLLLVLALVPVAPAFGVEPWIVAVTILASVLNWTLPTQTPEYLVAHSASEGRLYSHRQAQRASLVHASVVLAGLGITTLYRRALGLL